MPILLLANYEEVFPQFILLILDAQNAKGSWSVRQDAPVLLVFFSDPTAAEQAFLDGRFAANGKASGRFVAGGPEALDDLVATFRQGHLRFRVFSCGQLIRWLAPNR